MGEQLRQQLGTGDGDIGIQGQQKRPCMCWEGPEAAARVTQVQVFVSSTQICINI